MTRVTDERETALRDLTALHEQVDREAGRVAERHAGRLACRAGCSGCCADGLRVFEVEAERIRRSHPTLLNEGLPHPPGACAFLDGAGSCRVYADRPYVCRTQGLPLRWWEDGGEAGAVEQRDVCGLNLTGVDLTGLEPADCWTIGPVEARLRELQQRFSRDDGRLGRVVLRSLFATEWSRPLG